MDINWEQAFEIVVLVFILNISNYWSGALGGFFHFIISATIKLPFLGRLFKFILQRPLYVIAVTKPVSWLISSSGLLIGLGIHQIFWGSPDTPIEFLVILGLAIISIFEIVSRLISFDQDYSYLDALVSALKDPSNPLYGFSGSYLNDLTKYGDRKDFQKLARSLFVDQNLPQLFRLLMTIGVIYFCVGHLGLVTLTGSHVPDIWESLLLSFSVINITGQVSSPYSGQLWEFLRLIAAFLAFFWLVMFVSLSVSSVDPAAVDAHNMLLDSYKDPIKRIVEEAIAKTQASLANTSQSPTSTESSDKESSTFYS